MAKKKTIRVYKDGDVWVAKKDGTTKASAIRNTQKEAYLAARSIALNQGLSITIYYPTGGIHKVINPQEKSSDDNCFITTACVKYYGLEDDCYELEILRNFRDRYMLENISTASLVKEYYKIAPSLVKKLESDTDKHILFEEIFSQIGNACKSIENERFEEAKDIYSTAVQKLLNRYNN